MRALSGSGSHRLRIARLVAATLAAAAPLSARPAGAQAPVWRALDGPDVRGLAWAVELGAVGATHYVEDGNGVTTRAGLGPYLGAGASLAIANRISLTSGVRWSTATLRVESSGREWRAGRTHQYDFRIGVETRAARHLGIAASAFAARVTGPDDVIPFRSAGRISVWGGELAAYLRVRDPNIDLLIAGDAARLGAQRRENPPLAAGWVGRLRLGARRVFP